MAGLVAKLTFASVLLMPLEVVADGGLKAFSPRRFHSDVALGALVPDEMGRPGLALRGAILEGICEYLAVLALPGAINQLPECFDFFTRGMLPSGSDPGVTEFQAFGFMVVNREFDRKPLFESVDVLALVSYRGRHDDLEPFARIVEREIDFASQHPLLEGR